MQQQAPVERAAGHDAIPGHPGDRRWKRRVRGVLQALRASGRAQRIAHSTWAIHGPPERPARLTLIVSDATLGELELRVQDAVELLGELAEPVDLVVADPPYALNRGRGRFAVVMATAALTTRSSAVTSMSTPAATGSSRKSGSRRLRGRCAPAASWR